MRLPLWAHGAIWLLFAGVVYLPLAQLGFETLISEDGLDPTAWRVLLLTGGQWRLLGDSLLLAAGASALAVALGVPYAFLCEKTRLFGRRVFRLAYLAPLLIPPYMHAIVWSRLLAKNGPVNAFLMEHLSLASAPLDIHGLGGAIFVLALAYFPFVTLLTLSGLKTLDRSYEEAALLQRGGPRTVWGVTLPMVRPHILAGALFVFVFALIDFGVPDILRVQTYPVEIFVQFSALYDEQAAILLSFPLLVVTALAIGFQVRTMGGRSYVSLGAGLGTPLRYEVGHWRSVGFLYCALLIGLSVAVPLLALMVTAGPWATYAKALRTSGEQILDSLLLAASAAAIMTLFSLFVAASIQCGKGKWRTLMEYLSQIPFAVPPIVLGIGMIKLWNRPATEWLYGTSAIIVLGYVAHFIPFAVRAVYANIQQVNPRLLEAGRLSGAGTIQVGLRVALPLLRNGLLVAFFIVFVLALGELGVTLLVTPPGTTTLPIKIYNYMHYGAEATVSALSLILVAIQLVVAMTLFGMGRWLSRGAQ